MKAVLFDLDGTLLDTLEDLYLSVNHSLNAFGLPPRTLGDVRRFLGNGAAYLIQRSLPEGKEMQKEEVLAAFREYYARHSGDHTCPYPKIPLLLEKLEQKGYVLAVLSNKPDFAVQTLSQTHFPHMHYCAGEKEGIPRKPDPTPLLEAMKTLGVEKKDCVYVGDSEVDIKTAENTGIPCISVTWGFRDREELEKAGALHLADSVEELEMKLEELL